MDKEDIARLIAKRDNISFNEAMEEVEACIAEINAMLDEYDGAGLYDEATEIIADYLGLEPDYLEYLL